MKILPSQEFQRLSPHLVKVALHKNQTLFHVGEKIERAYFPCGALISFTAFLESGKTKEVCLVGGEGMVGLPIILEGELWNKQTVVQEDTLKLGIKQSACYRHFS